MRKELDEVKNAMKGKKMINLDGMIKRTDSPFTTNVLEFPIASQISSPIAGGLWWHKDLLDHIGAFKTILNL